MKAIHTCAHLPPRPPPPPPFTGTTDKFLALFVGWFAHIMG